MGFEFFAGFFYACFDGRDEFEGVMLVPPVEKRLSMKELLSRRV